MPHQCTECGETFPDGSKEMLSGCPECGGNKFQFKPSSAVDTGSGAAGRGHGQPSRSQPDQRGDRSQRSAADDASQDRTSGGRRGQSDDSDGRAHGEWPEGPEPENLGATADIAPDPDSEPDRGSSPADDRSLDRDARDARDASDDHPANEARDDHPASDARDDRSTSDRGAGKQTQDRDDADFVDSEADQYEDRAQASARTDVVSPDELPASGGSSGSADAGDDPGTGSQSPTHRRDSPAGEPPEADQQAGHEQPGLDELRQELNDQFESIRIVSPGQYELNLMELYDRQEYIISLQEDGRYVIEMPGDWGPGDE